MSCYIHVISWETFTSFIDLWTKFIHAFPGHMHQLPPTHISVESVWFCSKYKHSSQVHVSLLLQHNCSAGNLSFVDMPTRTHLLSNSDFDVDIIQAPEGFAFGDTTVTSIYVSRT